MGIAGLTIKELAKQEDTFITVTKKYRDMHGATNNQTVKVNHWRGSMREFGHLSMELPCEVYISFYPEYRDSMFKKGSRHPTFKDDVDGYGRLPDETLEIPIYHFDEKKIKEYWEYLKIFGKYNLFTFNCAHVIYMCFENFTTLSTSAIDCVKGLTTPENIFKQIRYYKKHWADIALFSGGYFDEILFNKTQASQKGLTISDCRGRIFEDEGEPIYKCKEIG